MKRLLFVLVLLGMAPSGCWWGFRGEGRGGGERGGGGDHRRGDEGGHGGGHDEGRHGGRD